MNREYSVIVAARNATDYISETLESILNQTCNPSEVIVVIDGPDELLEKKVRAVDSKIRVFVRPHAGQAIALNFGIRQTNYQYISFLDADDYWSIHKMKRQIDILEENSNIDAVSCGVRNFLDDPNDQQLLSYYRDFPGGRILSATTFRRHVFERFGYFPENVSSHQWVYVWWHSVTQKNLRIQKYDDIGLYRRIHQNNIWKTEAQHGYSSLLSFLRTKIAGNPNALE